MKKPLLLLLLFTIALYAKDIAPDWSLTAKGGVVDAFIKEKSLYIATDAGSVEIFDLETKKRTELITLPQIKDFMGDAIDSKIYSVDTFDGAVLILSQDNGGFRRIDIYKEGKLEHIITKEDRLYIAKAKFLNAHTLLLGLLSNVIISYDIKSKKYNFEEQITLSKFSNYAFNADRSRAIIADESGDLHTIDTKTGKIVATYTGLNVDNVYQVDWKNGVIATAGQDRRVAIYDEQSAEGYYKSSDFLIYSVGLSANGALCGYASDEQNRVTVFNTGTKQDLVRLTGNKMNISNILFINAHEIVVTCDGDTINHYTF